jgi:hypothetical protein
MFSEGDANMSSGEEFARVVGVPWVVLGALGVLTGPVFAQELANRPMHPDAHQVVEESLQAMGGAEKLSAVRGLTFTATRTTPVTSVAPTDDAPPMLIERVTDQMDLERKTLKETSSLNFTGLASDINTVSVYSPQGGFTDSNGDLSALAPAFVYRAEDLFLITPMLALQSAARDSRAVLENTESVSGFPCTWISFSTESMPLRVCVSVTSKLPVALEFTRDYPQDDYAALWGRFVTRYTFTRWTIDSSGRFFPRTWREETGHGQNSMLYIQSITFGTSSPAPLAVPANFKEEFVKTMRRTAAEQAAENYGSDDPVPLGNAVYALPGKLYRRNVLLVRQTDGVVIIEAPVSPQHSVYVRSQAAKLFPGSKIKAVISTDNIWGHVAGIAGYADTDIPLYVLDRNVDLIKRLLEVGAAKHDRIHLVASRTTIGSGINSIELIPYRTPYGARMMAVYLPSEKLLWASDLFLPKRWQADDQAEHLWEIRQMIAREQIQVERIMGDHRPPEEWAAVIKDIPDGV